MLLIDAQCRICWLSAPYAGTWHDTTLVADAVYTWPAGSVVVQDRGFQGGVVPGRVMRQPTKQPRGGALTAAQRAENAQLAREKMRIEHTIGSGKRGRSVKDVIR